MQINKCVKECSVTQWMRFYPNYSAGILNILGVKILTLLCNALQISPFNFFLKIRLVSFTVLYYIWFYCKAWTVIKGYGKDHWQETSKCDIILSRVWDRGEISSLRSVSSSQEKTWINFSVNVVLRVTKQTARDSVSKFPESFTWFELLWLRKLDNDS